MKPAIGGPGDFFVRHRILYAVSLSGTGTATGVFASRAARSQGLRRLGWVLLFALEAVIFVGIVTATEGSRRSAPRE